MKKHVLFLIATLFTVASFSQDTDSLISKYGNWVEHYKKTWIDANLIRGSSYTAGRILYSNGGLTTSVSANLNWDAGNNRLTVTGGITKTGNADLVLEHSTGNNLFGIDLRTSAGSMGLFKANQSTGEVRIGGANSGYFLSLYSSNTEVARFSTTGLFGLGTTAPTHTLTLPSTSTGAAYYNTSDQTTNLERLRIYWSGNALNIRTEQAGTGANRNIVIGPANTTLTMFGSSNAVGFFNYFMASSSANAAGVSIAGTGSTWNASSGVNNIMGIGNHINQSGTAGFRSFFISPYIQATGSGIKYLLDVGKNTAVNYGGTHTRYFSVDYLGQVNFANVIEYTDNAAATSAGLSTGDVYRTGDALKIVH